MLNNNSHPRIKKLSPLLINQLAAGEVVTRPAAVVKELLENAIDAGATQIEVRITQGGMGMIEVMDNGLGIHPDDMVMAVTRHATSKVADVATLQGINTLGFRGEALSAMAAVSRLTLMSSHDDSGVGRQLQLAGVLAEHPKLTPVVHNRGTTVTIKDLYFNVPARRGNLKSIATEFVHIETIIREVALARADVALSLSHDNKKRLSLTSHTSADTDHLDNHHLPLSRLEQALGVELTADAIDINVDLSGLLQSSGERIDHSRNNNNKAKVSGWLWVNHHSQLPKLIYVNGRLIKEPLISNQLRQLAGNAQVDNIGYALYLDLPTQWLNVNVHPTKQRIRISPLNNIMAHLAHTISLKLKGLSPNIKPITDINNSSVIDIENNADSRVSKKLNRHSSLKQRTNKEVSYNNKEINYSDYIGQACQQVAAPQAQYQRDARQELTADPSKNNKTLTASSIIDHTGTLPYCLDILSHYPNCFENDVPANSNNSRLNQSLLFYSHAHCLLVTEDDWQNIWHTLCHDKLTTQSKSSYLAEPIDAPVINQQINQHAAQLSAQTRYEFSFALASALKKYAHAHLTTEQLLSVMLSSTLQ